MAIEVELFLGVCGFEVDINDGLVICVLYVDV